MRFFLVTLICLSLFTTSAFAEPPPSYERPPRSGLAGVIVGSIGLGVAAVNFGTLPLCFDSPTYPYADHQAICLGFTVGYGVAGLVTGITGLGLGVPRRRAYKEWRNRARYGRSPGFEGLSVGLTPQHTGLNARFHF